jgi:hypothetical protein
MQIPQMKFVSVDGHFLVDGTVFVAEADAKANKTDGQPSSRLRVVVSGPRACAGYLKNLMLGQHLETGHNPAGGLMVIVLLLAVLVHEAA